MTLSLARVRSRMHAVVFGAVGFMHGLVGMTSAVAILSVSPAVAIAMDPPANGVVLVVDGAMGKLDANALRAAMASELGVAVTLASTAGSEAPSLVLRLDAHGHATLTYVADNERSIGRTIDLPDDAARATEMLALLAGNLVRDEAAELAASFGKRPVETPTNEETADSVPSKPERREPKVPAMERPAKPPSTSPVVRAPEVVPAPVCVAKSRDIVTFGADVIPFVGTSLQTGTNVVRHYSLNFLASYTMGLSGVEASLGANIESSFVCGFQVANVANVVFGPVRGVQFTGGVNVASSVHGVQVGGVNVNARDMAGVQLGVVNVTAKTAQGVQAGLLNVTADDVFGVQLGLVNVAAKNAKGVQIGLVNTADRSTFSLGALNIIRNGRTHLDLWGLESGIVMLGLKHGSDTVHNIYGAGMRVGGADIDAAFSLGLGGRIPISERLFADIDALGYSLHKAPSLELRTLMGQVRAVLGARLAPRFAIYGGPTYNVAFSPVPADSLLSPYGSTVLSNAGKGPVRGWLGGVVGMQVF